jgi:hypothetical protein
MKGDTLIKLFRKKGDFTAHERKIKTNLPLRGEEISEANRT